ARARWARGGIGLESGERPFLGPGPGAGRAARGRPQARAAAAAAASWSRGTFRRRAADRIMAICARRHRRPDRGRSAPVPWTPPKKETVGVTPKEVLALVRQREVTTVDLRYMDFPGVWQHFSIPADALTEETFEEGVPFDGSSVVGWRAINEADLLVVPQPETVLIDPFTAQPTLTMICNIQDPITQQDYTRDPRNLARKAVSYMKSTGLADTCLVAPELEFFVFDDVRFDQRGHEAFYHVDSVEGAWNRGRAEGPNPGYTPGSGLGYFP